MVVVHLDYVYHQVGRDGGEREVIRLKCACALKERCPATASMRIATGDINVTVGHNHAPEKLEELKRDLDDVMKDLARRSFWNTEYIYERAIQSADRFSVLTEAYSFDQHISHFRNIVGYAAKNKELPEIITYEDLAKSLSQDEWVHLRKFSLATMDVIAFDSPDGSKGLIMGDYTLFQELMNDNNGVIYFSSTDIIKPQFSCRTDEVVVAMTEFKGGMFPFCWILLSGKSNRIRAMAVQKFKEQYNAGLNDMRRTFVTSSTWIEILREAFPRVTMKFAFHEICMTILTHARADSNIKMNDDQDFKKIVDFACLPLIEHGNIMLAQTYLSTLMDGNPDISRKFRLLKNVLNDQYLKPMQTMRSSCFDEITTCYNAMLNYSRDMQAHHQNDTKPVTPWAFFRERLFEVEKGHSNLSRLNRRLRIQTTPMVSVFTKSNSDLDKLWSHNTSSRNGLIKFLSNARIFVDKYLKDLAFFYPPPAVRHQEVEGDCFKCIRCDGYANHIAEPCGHLLFCTDCADGQRTCTECNQPIQTITKIFIPTAIGGNGNKDCFICTSVTRKIMAKNCKHLMLCLECWVACSDAKKATAVADGRPELTDEEIPCPDCNSESGGIKEIRFPH